MLARKGYHLTCAGLLACRREQGGHLPGLWDQPAPLSSFIPCHLETAPSHTHLSHFPTFPKLRAVPLWQSFSHGLQTGIFSLNSSAFISIFIRKKAVH